MTISSTIYKMFAQSPIKPIENHMSMVHSCAEDLLPFFEATMRGDWETAEKIQTSISEREATADDLKRDLRLNLPNNLLMPVARGDILNLITIQDRIANRAKDLSGLILSRQMHIPAAIAALYIPLLNTSIDTSKLANTAIHELDELLDTGFTDKVVKIVEAMLVKLNKLEHRTDEMQAKIRHKIFALEKELPAIEIIFLYKVVEWTGELADIAQNVGGQLQIFLAN